VPALKLDGCRFMAKAPVRSSAAPDFDRRFSQQQQQQQQHLHPTYPSSATNVSQSWTGTFSLGRVHPQIGS